MSEAPNTVFICGFPSSGTDLLKNVVNAHGEIYIGGEFPLLPSLGGRYGARVAAEALDAVVRDIKGCDVYGNLEREALPADFAAPCTFADVYVALLTSKQRTWYGNKTPQNAEHVDMLERLFPGSRYLLIVRDIRDVALSWRNKWGKDPLLCAHKWSERMQRALSLLQQHAPGRFLVLRYEDLLADYRGVAERICAFLDLPYDTRIDRFHDHVDVIVPGKLHYGEPVLESNREKWRDGLAERCVRRVEEIAFEALPLFQYSPELAERTRPITAAEKIIGRVKEANAMVFVGNRAGPRGEKGRVRRVIALELAKRLGRYRT